MSKRPGPKSNRETHRWYQRVGPGLITACVVIGPGSILTSSKVGAQHGYGMSWVVVIAVGFMMVYMTLGAKLGVVAAESSCTLITQRAGRWLAVVIGASVFFISGAFQFGNNLGVHSAFKVYEPAVREMTSSRGFSLDFDYVVVVFNALSIAFLFGFKNLYRAVERLMMAFVGLMLFSFAVNLFIARPAIGELITGFVPGAEANVDLSVLGLVGTTFVITAAFFQTYLVRRKGWGIPELKDGLLDARVGAVIMALITLMIMTTAGTVLRGKNLVNVADVAQQLEPLFGETGRALFCIGLFSAAYSSFMVNSMIGGFILADGLGFDDTTTDWWSRIFTVGVLLTGMGVALYVIKTGWNPVPAIVAAQAVTVVASPLVAGALWWLTSREDVMGTMRNARLTNVLAGVGFLLLLAIATYTAVVKIPEGLTG
jgi:Mn2+/Fe2+ NRAMP family transporter